MNHSDAITHQIQQNLQQIKEQISQACKRAERSEDDICFVAVTKYAQIEWVQTLVSLGVTNFGESRPQQLIERASQFDDSINWHLIGHLQRNKVRSVLPAATLIHSIDSVRLLNKINLEAEKQSIQPQVLLEVNIAEDASKDGFSPDSLKETWNHILQYQAIDIVGLMVMAPFSQDTKIVRQVFSSLRALRDDLQENAGDHINLNELSMGMSNDFEIAIEEGATMIRIGSNLYEGLT